MPAELLSVLHFFMQVLTSGEDDEVKLECCKILSRRHKFADFAPPKIDFSRFKTFEDFAISLDVYGIPLDLCSAICLLCKRPKWMISLSERCPDTVDQSFPMSSFVCRNTSRILDIFLDNARKRAA